MPDLVLQEQVDYYRARAAEYDEWFYRKGRYDHGDESNRVWFEEADSVFDALDTMAPTGDVLELAPGTGIWTERLLRTARYVTAIDASSEMIARNRAKLGNGATRVTFQVADIFEWKPSVKFDAIVFCFWISHVPATRLDQFLDMIASALKGGGQIFFVDGRKEPSVMASNQIMPAVDTEFMTRKLNDGREFQIVKNYYQPSKLAHQFASHGLDVDVRETPTLLHLWHRSQAGS